MTHASHCCSAWKHPLQQPPAAALLQQICVYEATNWARENLAPVLPAVPGDKSSSPQHCSQGTLPTGKRETSGVLSTCQRQMRLHALLEHVDQGREGRQTDGYDSAWSRLPFLYLSLNCW